MTAPLFATVEDMRAMIAPHIGRDRFRSLVTELQRQGFPQPDPSFKAYYMPAVRAWLDGRARLCQSASAARPDGPENWGEPEGKRRDIRRSRAGFNPRPIPQAPQERVRLVLAGGLDQPAGR